MMHMHHGALDIDDMACACTALRKASRAVTRLYDEALAAQGTGMTTIQFSILRTIARHQSLPLPKLAALLVMERTTLYRALGPMEAHGWIAFGNAGGRAKTVSLTDDGRRALAAATGVWKDLQARFLGKIGLGDWREIETSLARLVAIARDVGP